MKQLFSTLTYLNNQSIVHRDLKLQNIVFLKSPFDTATENLEIKLIDFGTAIKVYKNKKNPSGLVGTLLYIAPEFTKGFFTEKCDIWSAGVIFFQLLFQSYPFKGRSEKEILN
jgi:calcium-dependent protein kinase